MSQGECEIVLSMTSLPMYLWKATSTVKRQICASLFLHRSSGRDYNIENQLCTASSQEGCIVCNKNKIWFDCCFRVEPPLDGTPSPKQYNISSSTVVGMEPKIYAPLLQCLRITPFLSTDLFQSTQIVARIHLFYSHRPSAVV